MRKVVPAWSAVAETRVGGRADTFGRAVIDPAFLR